MITEIKVSQTFIKMNQLKHGTHLLTASSLQYIGQKLLHLTRMLFQIKPTMVSSLFVYMNVHNAANTDFKFIRNTCLIDEKLKISKFITWNSNDNSYSGYRTDICNENVINSQLHSYQFHCNGIENVFSISYYQNTNKCNSRNLFIFLPITITHESIIGFQCDFPDYMNTNVNNTFDTSTHDIITVHCLKDTNNYCVYECTNNCIENGYFTIKYFNNHLCEAEPYNIISYSESDGYNNKLTHMIWCNGANDVHVPVIDQGKALNICSDKRIISGKPYSFENGIDKYVVINMDHKLEHLYDYYADVIVSLKDNGYQKSLPSSNIISYTLNHIKHVIIVPFIRMCNQIILIIAFSCTVLYLNIRMIKL